MAKEIINTPAGLRLRDTKTKKLAGAPPQKAVVPTPKISPVVKPVSPRNPKTATARRAETPVELFWHNGAWYIHTQGCSCKRTKAVREGDLVGVYATLQEAQDVWEQRNEHGATEYPCTDTVRERRRNAVKAGKAIAEANDRTLHEEGLKRFPNATPEELEHILHVEAMNNYDQGILTKIKRQETASENNTDKKFLDSLESYIQSWIEEGNGDSMIAAFKKPEWAAGMCEEASASFGSHLKTLGIESEIVNVQHIVTKAPHAVVKVGNTVVDWTLRQFNRTADVPSVSNLNEFNKVFTVISSRPSEAEENDDEESLRLVAEIRHIIKSQNKKRS